MSDILVECYAGYISNQRPQRFKMGGQSFEVLEVEDQWYSPSSKYFRVRASDGNVYVLRYNEEEDRWSLDAYRRHD